MNEHFNEMIRGKVPVLVDFSAEWKISSEYLRLMLTETWNWLTSIISVAFRP